jgi:hypothetical protein
MLNLSNQETFFKFNHNIFETNVINIVFLVLLLFYLYRSSFQFTIKLRQNEILQNIENSQKDLIKALDFYKLSEKQRAELIFYLNNKKKIYYSEKVNVIRSKIEFLINNFSINFSTSESLLINFQFKSLLILQNYILLIITSKILKKFYLLSENEQVKILEVNINKLKQLKNEYKFPT